MLILILKKDGREGFAGTQLRLSFHQIRTLTLTVPFAEDSTEEEEQGACCVYSTGRFSEDHNRGEWIRCKKYFRWAHTLCTDMKIFFCEPCQG
jgi:hypothetical protein